MILSCPHCNDNILVEKNEINCAIFRHAVFKNTHEQLNPHAPMQVCDDVVKKGLVWGCAKPFKVVIKNDVYHTVKCEYI